VTISRRYLERFGIFQVFDEAEVKHWILPRPGIISCYVLEQNKKITDFVSFYHLNSTILGHAKHKTLNACYMYYRVATTGAPLFSRLALQQFCTADVIVTLPLVTLTALMQDALIIAKNGGVDVFNALDLMGSTQMLSDLKFGAGDGALQCVAFVLCAWYLQRHLLMLEQILCVQLACPSNELGARGTCAFVTSIPQALEKDALCSAVWRVFVYKVLKAYKRTVV
jgi:hypothetical protein